MNPQLTEQRPLDQISDFVAECLPAVIDATQAQGNIIATAAEALVVESQAATRQLITRITRAEFRLALFDLTMLETAIVANKGVPGPLLERTTSYFARVQDVSDTLSYDGLVCINPLDTDPRSFTGNSNEQLFYQIHRDIERQCLAYARTVMPSIEMSVESYFDRAVTEGLLILDSMQRNFQRLANELSPSAFMQFRRFFEPNQLRGAIMGPSGKHSAGMAVVDAITCGNHPAVERLLKAKINDLKQFPSSELPSLKDIDKDPLTDEQHLGKDHMFDARHLAEKNRTLLGRFNTLEQTSSRREQFIALLIALRDLRKLHVSIVAQFVPQAFTGAKGTGGEPQLGAYLMRPIAAYQEVIDSVVSKKFP